MPKLKKMNPGCCCGTTPTPTPCVPRPTWVARIGGPAGTPGGSYVRYHYSFTTTIGGTTYTDSGDGQYFANYNGNPTFIWQFTETLQLGTFPTGITYGAASATIQYYSDSGLSPSDGSITWYYCIVCGTSGYQPPAGGYVAYGTGDTSGNCPPHYVPPSPYMSTPAQSRAAIAALPARHYPARTATANVIRVGMVMPWGLMGGGEAMSIATMDALNAAYAGSGTTIQWTGIAVINTPLAAPMLADLQAMAPVTTGLPAAQALAGSVDLIITWAVLDYALLYAGMASPPKTIFVCHLPSAWGPATPAMLAAVNRFVAVSPYAAATVPSQFQAITTTILNAIDPKRLPAIPPRTRATVRAAWGVSLTAHVVLFIGRLSSEKDPDAMFRAATANPGVTFVVVGDGPLMGAMTAGTPSNLKLVGTDDDRTSCYLASDHVLVPSQFESFGLTMAEAATLGVPIISTAVGVAAQFPGLARTIPVGATGLQIGQAIAADMGAGVGLAVGGLTVGLSLSATTTARVVTAKATAVAQFGLGRLGLAYRAVIDGLMGSAKSAEAPKSRLASTTLIELRKATCDDCDQFAPPDLCRACGCGLAAKRAIVESECPLRKWGELD